MGVDNVPDAEHDEQTGHPDFVVLGHLAEALDHVEHAIAALIGDADGEM